MKNTVTSQADPWAHRSEGMLCKTCMWFVEKKGTELGRMILGRCRRHAPTMSGYPVCFSKDWCGDHKLSENHAGQKEKAIPTITPQEWKARCAARLIKQARIDKSNAMEIANNLFLRGDLKDSPEGAAYEELVYWADDAL